VVSGREGGMLGGSDSWLVQELVQGKLRKTMSAFFRRVVKTGLSRPRWRVPWLRHWMRGGSGNSRMQAGGADMAIGGQEAEI